MEKIDYGDINKFLVSTGLVLISLSLVLPYLYLREDFGLYITSDQVAKLNDSIKELIQTRQNQVLFLQKTIPWLSVILFTLGVLSSSIGLKRWFKRQSQIDRKYDLDIEKLLLEIQSLTPEEKVQKAKNEVQEIELEQMLETETKTTLHTPQDTYLKYIQIEKDIIQQFKGYLSKNYEIYDQQKLGGRYQIDLLLKSNSKNYADKIIEIKYFKKQFPIKNIRSSLFQLNTYLSYYAKAVSQNVMPVLIIVYSPEIYNEAEVNKFKDRLRNESKDIPNLEKLIVKFIPEDKIDKMDISSILEKE